MAVLVQNTNNGHIQIQMTRSLERLLEKAQHSGDLKLSNMKLRDFPTASDKYNLRDTISADLSKNRFSELPEEITQFPFLEKLQCYHNTIRYIPESIGSLQCLNFLDLSRNQLTALPRELCHLPIKVLIVSYNDLTSLPDDLHRMAQLTELDASCNQLTHLPPRLGDLRTLHSLILRDNLLLALPLEVTFLPLIRLDLRANRIHALPVELRDMTYLVDLLVEDNPLTLPPASLCKRGRVHIFKHLDIEAGKLGKGTTNSCGGTLGRKQTRDGTNNGPSTLICDRLKSKRYNVDSGYSTGSDGYDKRWSQEILGDAEKHWIPSPLSLRAFDNNNTTYSSASSSFSSNLELSNEHDRTLVPNRYSPNDELNSIEEKNTKPIHQMQTYREYKEALKQQRSHDVQPIYRTRDNEEKCNNNMSEPNTPAHHQQQLSRKSTMLATSKSDPTPLSTVLDGSTLNDNHNLSDSSVKNSPPPPSSASSPLTTSSLMSMRKSPPYVPPPPPPPSSNMSNGGTYQQIDGKKVSNYMKPKSSNMETNNGTIRVKPLTNNNRIVVNGGTNSISLADENGCIQNGKITSNLDWNKNHNSNNINNNSEKMTFTMRREIDKAREETDLINHLRNIIESRLKMALPDDLATALSDGVVLCHLANLIKPRSVASIHVPSPAVPKLTMARCRRNVDNFIEACRKIGVDEKLVCCSSDILEGRGLVQIAITVVDLLRFFTPKSPMHSHNTHYLNGTKN